MNPLPRPQSAERADASAPDRVVVRGLNWLGDALMAVPALTRLRQALPHAHIALVTPEKLSDLWVRHPSVDEVLAFGPSDPWWRIGGAIRLGRFDLGIVFPNSPRSALELWWGGVRRRIGYDRPWRRWFLTQTVASRPGERPMRKRSRSEIHALLDRDSAPSAPPAFPPKAHHIHHYLELVAQAAGASNEPVAPRLPVFDGEVAQAAKRLGWPLEAGRRKWIALNAGAEYGPAKRWPVDRFAALACRLLDPPIHGLVLTGGPGDRDLAGRLEVAIRAGLTQDPGARLINLAGRTRLRELAAVFRGCRVVVTNDSGPMHLAAAVDTPVVALFGSTDPRLTAPGLPGDAQHRVLHKPVPCSPCFLRECPVDSRCLAAISVDEVEAAVRDLIETQGTPPATLTGDPVPSVRH